MPQLVGEADGGGAPLRDYTFGETMVSMNTVGDDYFFHHDGLGSVAALTSTDGTPQWTYDDEPFGELRGLEQLDPSAPANPMRFTGEYLDDTSGLYNLRARQYDPSTGRFLATDPLAPLMDRPSVSSYAYVSNRPGVLVDPLGLRGCGWRDLGNCLDDAVDWIDEHKVGILEASAVGAGLLAIPVSGGASLGLAAGAVGLGVTAEAVDSKPCRWERVKQSAVVGGVSAIAGGVLWGGASQTARAADDITSAVVGGRIGSTVGVGSFGTPLLEEPTCGK